MFGGSRNALFGFVIGILVVVVAGMGWYIATDGDPLNQRSEVVIELPSFGD
ncbi:MAG: hypothetical protein ACXIU8_12795 [Alkalilacustris sp.]